MPDPLRAKAVAGNPAGRAMVGRRVVAAAPARTVRRLDGRMTGLTRAMVVVGNLETRAEVARRVAMAPLAPVGPVGAPALAGMAKAVVAATVGPGRTVPAAAGPMTDPTRLKVGAGNPETRLRAARRAATAAPAPVGPAVVALARAGTARARAAKAVGAATVAPGRTVPRVGGRMTGPVRAMTGPVRAMVGGGNPETRAEVARRAAMAPLAPVGPVGAPALAGVVKAVGAATVGPGRTVPVAGPMTDPTRAKAVVGNPETRVRAVRRAATAAPAPVGPVTDDPVGGKALAGPMGPVGVSRTASVGRRRASGRAPRTGRSDPSPSGGSPANLRRGRPRLRRLRPRGRLAPEWAAPA
jgi:hypothetical protein